MFECTDCLECANCCTTTGPLFTDKDISRIAKSLRIKLFEFVDRYLRIDEDNDYVSCAKHAFEEQWPWGKVDKSNKDEEYNKS